jgi:preprotein translocase subunit SecA
LLDFAPPQHRAQLESMADEGVWDGLDRDDIERIYAAGGEERHWARRSDPWSFYSPEEIEARQRRWADGDSPTEDEEDIFDGEADLDVVQTYVRSTPKIGRNDPCPCGSGKKYKKCCLAAGDSRS